MQEITVFSFGGGVQSHAVLVLAAQGKIAVDVFVFANVGNDSENPDTLAYIRDYTIPYCSAHGLQFVEVQRVRRTGQLATLAEEIYRDTRSVVIPVRMSGNGALGNRNCTEDFKIKQIDKFLRYAFKPERVTVGLGISLDEFERARSAEWHNEHNGKRLGFFKRRWYPLLDARLTRAACHQLIQAAGLPPPPKSSCFFCPFKSRPEWIRMKQDRPDLFERAVDIERACNAKRTILRRDAVYLHPDLKPLDKATGDQLALDLDSVGCESGYCFT